jgi:hypothetical protein
MIPEKVKESNGVIIIIPEEEKFEVKTTEYRTEYIPEPTCKDLQPKSPTAETVVATSVSYTLEDIPFQLATLQSAVEKQMESEKLQEIVIPFSEEEIIIVVKTLHGEAHCVKSKAERAMVVWVILNRYDSGKFGKTLTEICTAPRQFTGYRADNPVDEECVELVKDVMRRWVAEKNGETNVGRTIPADYLFFSADSQPAKGIWHNKFYKYTNVVYGDKVYYDRDNPVENPYE